MLHLGSWQWVREHRGKHNSFQAVKEYLGVYLDQTLSLQQHISSVYRSTFLELLKRSLIRSNLSRNSTARLVSSMINSRLDYYNYIFEGLLAEQIARLQMFQNCPARPVMRKSKREHITPLLKKVHWLPAKFRIQYKIATFAYRHYEGSLPPDIVSAPLRICQPSRSLPFFHEKIL